MIPEAPRRARLRHVTSTGTAVAAALLPLAVGVLLARTTAGDPLAPVNALITTGGRRAGVSPAVWKRCGRAALSDAGTRINGAALRLRAGRSPSLRPGARRRRGTARRPVRPAGPER
ncbi:hypothetical protein ACF068_29815 [Streptomyces sp. NPDC016309]|uniref:hypothetical protein n=1 Tax=Streptomyces sp. NPDC016309 TaxID=3364965 RepID=UPI0036FA1690